MGEDSRLFALDIVCVCVCGWGGACVGVWCVCVMGGGGGLHVCLSYLD